MLRAKAAFLEMFEAGFPGLPEHSAASSSRFRADGPIDGIPMSAPRLGDLAYTEIPMFGRI